ncbi:MAG: molybdopterin molybdotransferase MoeA [Desulfoferrobacter sp.]
MELMEAKALVKALVPPGGIEWVWLDQALGRVLAETRYSNRDLPGEARSLLDGFAIISADTISATPESPCNLTTRYEISAAGDSISHKVSSGECIRILTGAPLPGGADAVIPQEKVLRIDERIIVHETFSAGTGLRTVGSDINKDELLLNKGVVLTPTRLSLLAALGYSSVPVFRQPRVALLATGNEVREIGESIEGPFTYCNNRYLLAWSASLQGGKPIHLGATQDDPDLIAKILDNADAEFIISTGGVGRGDRDFILAAWETLGVTILFEEINLSPGHGTALGKRGKQIFLAFPGNPWGAQAAFEQLATVALHKYQGLESYASPCIPAILERTIRKPAGSYKAIRGALHQNSSILMFRPADKEKKYGFSNINNTFSYILLESHVSESSSGSEVQARFYDFPLLALPLFGVRSAREGNYA